MVMQSSLSKGADKFDTELLISECNANGVMENVGGIKYLKSINSMKVSPKNFPVYLGSVSEAATKYHLYNTLRTNMSEIVNNAKEGLSSLDLLSATEADILDLSMRGVNVDEPIHLGEGLKEWLAERKENAVTLSGMSTGYPILDKQIDGMIPTTLLIIAARKKMGKSTLLTNIATHVSVRERTPVLYVDTELHFEEWRTRALANISGVAEREIKHGGYSEETYRRLLKAEEAINKSVFLHEYMPGYSVDKLVALYKKYKHKENIGLIVFDYLKEPDSTSVDRQRKEYQVLGDVTTKLKDLAGQLNVPALTAVQLNRDNDVADSDRIARYGDVIAHWATRDEDEQEQGGLASGTHKLVIKDTRRGGATSKHGIGYFFFKEQLIIKEVPADKQYFSDFDKVQNADSAGNIEDYDEELL
jgi:replicative DNA helicase